MDPCGPPWGPGLDLLTDAHHVYFNTFNYLCTIPFKVCNLFYFMLFDKRGVCLIFFFTRGSTQKASLGSPGLIGTECLRIQRENIDKSLGRLLQIVIFKFLLFTNNWLGRLL